MPTPIAVVANEGCAHHGTLYDLLKSSSGGGMSAGGMSAGGMSAGGMSAGGIPPNSIISSALLRQLNSDDGPRLMGAKVSALRVDSVAAGKVETPLPLLSNYPHHHPLTPTPY